MEGEGEVEMEGETLRTAFHIMHFCLQNRFGEGIVS